MERPKFHRQNIADGLRHMQNLSSVGQSYSMWLYSAQDHLSRQSQHRVHQLFSTLWTSFGLKNSQAALVYSCGNKYINHMLAINDKEFF